MSCQPRSVQGISCCGCGSADMQRIDGHKIGHLTRRQTERPKAIVGDAQDKAETGGIGHSLLPAKPAAFAQP